MSPGFSNILGAWVCQRTPAPPPPLAEQNPASNIGHNGVSGSMWRRSTSDLRLASATSDVITWRWVLLSCALDAAGSDGVPDIAGLHLAGGRVRTKAVLNTWDPKNGKTPRGLKNRKMVVRDANVIPWLRKTLRGVKNHLPP